MKRRTRMVTGETRERTSVEEMYVRINVGEVPVSGSGSEKTENVVVKKKEDLVTMVVLFLSNSIKGIILFCFVVK